MELQFYNDKRLDPLAGSWFVPEPAQPQLFTFMAKADLYREAIIGEIACEPFENPNTHQECALVDENVLHIALINVNGAIDVASVAGPDDDAGLGALETDGLEFFGRSQDQFASSQSQVESRDDRARNREEKKHARASSSSAGQRASSSAGGSASSSAARARLNQDWTAGAIWQIEWRYALLTALHRADNFSSVSVEQKGE